MASSFFGLDIGKSGLYTAQAGLNTTAHNIANIETEGYTRQKNIQKTGNPLRANGRHGMVGTGVNVTEIIQTRDAYYDFKYWKNNSMYGSYAAKENYMNQLQGYLNEIQLDGFTTTFDSFYDTIQELEKDPSSLTVRKQVSSVGQSFCDYFNALSSNLKSVQQNCNFEIKNEVDRINSYAQEIAFMTKQINIVELGGQNANDLRDQRNLLVDKLSTIINVSVDERQVGIAGLKTYTLKIDGQTLVDTNEAKTLSVVPREVPLNQNDADGLYDIVWDNGMQFNPYAPSQTGSIKALFEIRDGNNEENLQGIISCQKGDTKLKMTKANINSQLELSIPREGIVTVGNREYEYNGFAVTVDKTTGDYTYEFHLVEPATANAVNEISKVGKAVDYKGIPYYMSEMNEFIRTYAMHFNGIHKQGKDLNNDAGMDFFTGKHKVTGEDYVLGTVGEDFNSETGPYSSELNSYYLLTIENVSINSKIAYDPNLFAAASDVTNGVGNCDIGTKLLALKTDTSMFKQGKPDAFLQTMVADIGIDAQSAIDLSKSQSNLVQSVNNQRLSISGVDTEEEAMNLVHYQQAYNLSSKVISIMNEVYDKLINYMGA